MLLELISNSAQMIFEDCRSHEKPCNSTPIEQYGLRTRDGLSQRTACSKAAASNLLTNCATARVGAVAPAPGVSIFATPPFQTPAILSKQRLMIWLVFALLTGAALFSILAPLSRKEDAADPRASDLAFFKEQIAEIERESAEGRLAEQDAAAARLEAARRLLRTQTTEGEAAKSSRLAATIAALGAIVLIPAVSLTLYSRLGHSDLPDMPLSARLEAAPDRTNIAAAVARIEAHLAQHPEDGRGFEVVAPYYLRSGRAPDAVQAYAQALRLLGATAERHSALGEARVLAAEGAVTQEARLDFEAALQQDATQAMARFYLGLAAAQDGDRETAGSIWAKLLADAPPDAPWAARVKALLAKLDEAPSAANPPASAQGEAIAALPENDRQAAIRSMVERLAGRLEKNGDDVEGWLRLIRAYSVLSEPEKARQALALARKALASKQSDLTRVEALAQELKLGS
jgi:cytochrome c-type biogenesis protein CcmH